MTKVEKSAILKISNQNSVVKRRKVQENLKLNKKFPSEILFGKKAKTKSVEKSILFVIEEKEEQKKKRIIIKNKNKNDEAEKEKKKKKSEVQGETMRGLLVQ